MAASAETRIFVDGQEVHRRGPDGEVIDGEYRDVTDNQDAGDDEPPRRLPR